MIYSVLVLISCVFYFDLFIYLFETPGCKLSYIGIMLLLLLVLEYLIYQLRQNLKYYSLMLLKYIFITIAVIAVIILDSVSRNVHSSNWLVTNNNLDSAQLLLEKYILSNNMCPSSLNDILEKERRTNIKKIFQDGYRKSETYGLIVGIDHCTIYSVGPDGEDNSSEIAVSDDAFLYSKYSIPWRYMLTGNIYLKFYDYGGMQKGDIVRVSKLGSPDHIRE